MNPDKIDIDEEIDIDSCCDDEASKHRIMKYIGGPGSRRFFPHPGRHIFIKKHGKADKELLFAHRALMIQFLDEDENKIMIASLPGIKKETLSVKAKKRAVMIEGTYIEEFQKLLGETFNKRIRTPFEINPEQIEAQYTAGILKLIFKGIEDPTVDISVTSEDEY